MLPEHDAGREEMCQRELWSQEHLPSLGKKKKTESVLRPVLDLALGLI